MKKKVLKIFSKDSVTILICILLLGAYLVVGTIYNNKLNEANKKLREEIAILETENDNYWDLIIERNQEIYNLKMEKDEWQELFYSAIDFHPYEGYPYK